MLKTLEKNINSEKELISQILSANSSQNKILSNKNSGKEELLRIMSEYTRQREALSKSLVGFHELAREYLSEVEWTQIIKSFTRETQMSSR